ncbi:hypothetical protein B0H13DRAFT_2227232 [Mycena leptocephala]|nr:hypothetical protein B0H13DRAFT_2227232 [Mycena leptocephala]
MLRSAAASDAFHNSAQRFPQPKCHPETRTKMLKDILGWSSTSGHSDSVLWLHGPAGAGKPAIAQTFCQNLEAEGRLGATFFFKRGYPSRGTGNKLFPTIADQLAVSRPELKTAISQIVEDDPSRLDRAFPIQLRKLIIEPCRRSFRSRTLVIVIDGLDECEGPGIQQEILRSIGGAIYDSEGSLPLRFFVASRPEAHIQEMFSGTLHRIHHAMNINKSFDDVRRYLSNEFARIHREHDETMATIPLLWPSLDIIDGLVDKSSGYFI